MAAAAIRTSGLTKDYGGGHGLFDLELQVSTREAFGLLGPEGAGKTVAIRLLMGMLRPTRGSAYVFGLDCFRDAAEVKRRVGYVPGETPEFGAMRGGDIVAYLSGQRGGVPKDRVSELAERIDLDMGRRHSEYGRDDRQKLSIVLAFMHDPDLLILDEPSTDLEEREAATLHSLIDEARERGATILLASRAAAEVERHCEVVGLLRRGKLSRVMRVEDLPGELGERSRKALPPPPNKMKATLRALRAARWTVLAFAIAGFALTVLQSVAFLRMAGHTFAERAAFGYSLSLQAVANAVLLPPAVRPETVAGYLELRALEPLAILFAAWALVSATASTSRQTISGAAAFAISVTVAAAAACVGVAVGVASGGESVGGLPVAEAGVLLVALAISCYAICLIVARITPAATVVAGVLLVALFFLNSLSRVFTQQLATARWLSPFRYYDLSTPLPQAGHVDVGGFAMLCAIAALGTTVAALVPTGRTSAKPRRTTFEASPVSLLAFPVTRELYPQRIALAAWSIAFAALGGVLVVAARTSMQDLLALPRGLPGLPQYIFVFYAQVLSQTWFDAALLMFAALVFAFVARWAADDRDGRLEATLSAPYSRSRVVLERLTALAFTAAALAALSGLAVALTSRALNLALDSTRLAGACLVLVLFTVVLGAAGSLLASSVPRAAPILFGALLLASYLDDQIGAPLGLPRWVQDISPFRLVGAPLASDIEGRSVVLLLLLTLAGIGSSILAMQRRDVGA